MLITILRAKIHLASVTHTLPEYEGSIAIDQKLLEASGILPGEKVQVLNSNNGERFETYVIAGKKGEISLRGPAAKLGKRGDKVIVISYGHLTPKEAKKFKAKIIKVDEKNKILS